MRTARPKSLLERSADKDLWRHTLSSIPATTGKLVYLSSLRNPVTGRYEHHGLALLFGEEEADKAIRASHKKVFQDWLALELPTKVDDLEAYLRTLGEDLTLVLRHWLRSEAWVGFRPIGVLSSEKSLFASDMRNSSRILLSRFDGA